ncbi:MAG: ABC transporter ATP-binding protein [Flavobacteriales bacterium]|nr:ABC transporter ATP-binding protein [Flavobacteriales bacterium]MBK9700434.1 ABC transporter ATP-binding protein [Flavobacteriales bacterium]
MSPLLTVHDLHFAHDGRGILHGVGLELGVGEVLVVVGPSGCGKTTLLRLIAGLERPSAGRIAVQGRPMADAGTWVAPEARPVGFVFQGLALFPHLTVQGNVGFGLADRPRAERERRVREELAAVGLEGLDDRYPHQLSGGQQQRVAIARSLVRRPALMLMDEPFSDLDPATRAAVRQEVLRILRAHGTGAVVVTHDREDAFHLADRIAEMDQGRIVRIGPAADFRAAWSAQPFAP